MTSVRKNVLSDTCEISTIIPSRFISYTTSLPNSVRPSLVCGTDVSSMSPELSAQPVRVRPGQRHVAHAQRVVLPQQRQRVLDRVPALDAHQRGQLVLAVRQLDPVRRGHEHHLVRMLRRLLLDRVDQFQRALRVLALVERPAPPRSRRTPRPGSPCAPIPG